MPHIKLWRRYSLVLVNFLGVACSTDHIGLAAIQTVRNNHRASFAHSTTSSTKLVQRYKAGERCNTPVDAVDLRRQRGTGEASQIVIAPGNRTTDFRRANLDASGSATRCLAFVRAGLAPRKTAGTCFWPGGRSRTNSLLALIQVYQC